MNQECKNFFDSKKYIDLSYNGQIPKKYHHIKSKIKYFPCGEIEFEILENISNEEIIIFQSFESKKFNDNLITLKIVCDVLKLNNVKKIKYFAPFLPYTRQDKRSDNRISLGSKIIAEIINNCKINEIITYDLHTAEIEDFFTCKIHNLSMMPRFIDYIKKNYKLDNLIIVFPDAGSVLRFKTFFNDNSFKIVIINKIKMANSINMEIFDNVEKKEVIIIDDIIDSGKTLIEATNILKKNGAIKITAFVTHGIFSNYAIKKIKKSQIDKIIISDSIYKKGNDKKINVIKINI